MAARTTRMLSEATLERTAIPHQRRLTASKSNIKWWLAWLVQGHWTNRFAAAVYPQDNGLASWRSLRRKHRMDRYFTIFLCCVTQGLLKSTLTSLRRRSQAN